MLCACVCVCVYRCYSIFLRVYWRNNFQPRLDLLFQFSLELALLFMYLTFYCVMCSNCHQNVHKLRKYVCEWCRRWRGGEGSFANCRVRVQYLPALNRRCINIMCQHKKHSGHAQTQRWHTYTHTHTYSYTHTHTQERTRNTCKHRLKSFLALALPWRTVQWSELEMCLAWNMISYMNR